MKTANMGNKWTPSWVTEEALFLLSTKEEHLKMSRLACLGSRACHEGKLGRGLWLWLLLWLRVALALRPQGKHGPVGRFAGRGSNIPCRNRAPNRGNLPQLWHIIAPVTLPAAFSSCLQHQTLDLNSNSGAKSEGVKVRVAHSELLQRDHNELRMAAV